MRTQQAFFHHPWCLSIVCDPEYCAITLSLTSQTPEESSYKNKNKSLPSLPMPAELGGGWFAIERSENAKGSSPLLLVGFTPVTDGDDVEGAHILINAIGILALSAPVGKK